MYYRQKILLATIELFGGRLAKLQLHKLLFLFCRDNEAYYDFFPYKYGPCSFTIYKDKAKLESLGYLQKTDDFRLAKKAKGIISQLPVSTQMQLTAFKECIGPLHKDDLLKKVYVEYPYYASKSTIRGKVLGESQLQKQQKYIASLSKEKSLFTIGYEGISIDKYLDKLVFYRIDTLVDVRRNPISRKYGFSKSYLSRYATNLGITYIHIPELGIDSSKRKNLKSYEDYKTLFSEYEESTLQVEQQSIRLLKTIISKYNRVALTCFEADHTYCHRSSITNYFNNDDEFTIPINHI